MTDKANFQFKENTSPSHPERKFLKITVKASVPFLRNIFSEQYSFAREISVLLFY